MNFKEKCDFAFQELEQAGISRKNYYPPLVRLMHLLGIHMPLPHYNYFIINAFIAGIFFWVFWYFAIYSFVWGLENISQSERVLLSILAAIICGISMAFYYRYTFKKYNLTPWDKIS